MNSKQKFENFLESLKKNDNKALIESVKKGFQVCFEGIYDKSDISITSIPEGTTVYIDGNVIGKTPCMAPDIIVGVHKIKFELPMYFDKEIENINMNLTFQ